MKIKSLLVLFLCILCFQSFKKNHTFPLDLSYTSFFINKNIAEFGQNYSEIDKQLAVYVSHYGGGSYDSEMHAIVPSYPAKVQEHLEDLRSRISKAIGRVTPIAGHASSNWKNSATTEEELLEDAQAVAKELKEMTQSVAKKGYYLNKVRAYFGKDDEHLVKSRESLDKKLQRTNPDNKVEALQEIRDPVRGTLIVKNIHDLLTAIGLFKKKVHKAGWEVAFENIWSQTRASGYVGIHATLLIPVKSKGEDHFVKAEMQFHFKAIHDGTEESPKEREQKIYTIQRDLLTNQSSESLSSASHLIYTYAMEKIAEELEKEDILTFEEKELLIQLPRLIIKASIKHIAG